MRNFHRNFQAKIFEDRCSGRGRRGADDIIFAGTERRSSKDSRNGIERRKHRRYQVMDFTFVRLRSKGDEDIGQLLDIGHGGLSLRYFEHANKPRKFSELGIFLSGGDFVINEIPFIIVSDIKLDNNLPFSALKFRRYGLQFEYLTPDQKFKLDYFILNYTSGGADLKRFIRQEKKE